MRCWLWERLAWLASAILLTHGRSLEEQMKANYSFPIRLVGSQNSWEGNVEVFFQNEWGSVCDDEWGIEDATVVCRQLGLSGAVRHTTDSYFTQMKSNILLDSVKCTGHERELGKCGHDGWGRHDCVRHEAAGVICKTDKQVPTEVLPTINQVVEAVSKVKVSSLLSSTSHFTFSLHGGRNIGEGRVEVRISNGREPTEHWENFISGSGQEMIGEGLVCGDEWTLREGRVLCRQLGFGSGEQAVTTAHFGIPQRTPFLLSGIKCNGYEESLQDCVADPQIECSSGVSLAGVVCNHNLPDLQIDIPTIRDSVYLHDQALFYLQCAAEENCLARGAYDALARINGIYNIRRLLRFSTRTINIGTADFRPFLPREAWEWHQCHMHHHSMEVFSHYDVIDRVTLQKMAEGHKASFCLEDNGCAPHGRITYKCKNFGDQGISVGCYDEYAHDIDCQWIDITDLPPGQYFLQVSINPEFRVGELSFENNAVRCDLYYNLVQAFATNCHYIRM